jgi:biopolymer transport protein ExbB/TolQ
LFDPEETKLSWARSDIEQRLGFRGGRYTRVNTLLSFLLGLLGTVAFYAALTRLDGSWVAAMFTERGPTPYFICFLTSWSLAILLLKARKLSLQRRSLQLDVVPPAHDFVLSSSTVDQVMSRIHMSVDEPKHFILFDRISIALSNLRNLGRVSDVEDILRSQAEHQESAMETSYSLLKGFIWAIPVLGFIGTVLGLSQAIGSFGLVLENTEDIHQISTALKSVTMGLAIAFETTLAALVAAIVLQLLLTFLKRSEEDFLDACTEYCVRRIVSRLRIMPFERERE